MKLRNIAGISFIAFVLLSTFFPVQAFAAAGDETTTGAISLLSTIKCIGVVAAYTGDNNANNTAVLTYRVSPGGAWQTAPEMYNDRTHRQYRGSIFWLNGNTTYEVKVTFADANTVVGTNPVTGTCTTRDENPAIGTSYIYVATTGSDTTGDGSIGNPYKTIGKANTVVSAGKTVLVRAGTYSIPSAIAVSASGTSTNYITFMPYTGESVVLNGTNKLFTITGDYVRIKGFQSLNNSGTSAGNEAMIQFNGGDYGIVENCNFVTVTHVAIELRNGTSKTV